MTKNEIKNDIFIFRYDPNSSFEGMFEEFWEAVDGKLSKVEPNIVRSNSIEALTGNMTKNRLRMFQVLVEQKPANLSELATLLQKDYAMVRTDVKILEGMGIIKLEKLEKNARNGNGVAINYKEVKPIALYKRIVFDFPILGNVSVVGKKAVSGRSQNLHI
jgi:predicted transcriptional regulator